eukprot:54165_1
MCFIYVVACACVLITIGYMIYYQQHKEPTKEINDKANDQKDMQQTEFTPCGQHQTPFTSASLKLVLLLHGYIRKQITISCVPFDVIKLIKSFLHESRHIKLNNKLHVSEVLYQCKNLTFCCRLSKRDLYIKCTGIDKIYWSNCTVLRPTIYIQLYCNEYKYTFKDTSILGYGCMCLYCQDIYIPFNLSKSEHFTDLNFNLYIDVLKCRDLFNKKHYFYKPLRMKRSVVYEWNINEKQLIVFRNSEFGNKFYSNNFGIKGASINDCYWIECVPKAYKRRKMKQKIDFRLKIFRLPLKVKSITINYKINCFKNIDNKNILKHNGTLRISELKGDLFESKRLIHKSCALPSRCLNDIKSLLFVINMIIIPSFE